MEVKLRESLIVKGGEGENREMPKRSPAIVVDEKTAQREMSKIDFSSMDPRWVKFYYEYIKTGVAAKSARKAGFGVEFAKLIKTRLPAPLKQSIKQLAAKQGLVIEKVIAKTNLLLDAKKPLYKNNNATGKIEYVGDVDDFQSIDKGLTHAERILEIGQDKGKPWSNTVNVINLINLSDLDLEKQLEFATTGKIDGQVQ